MRGEIVTFDPNTKLTNLKGKDYLEVKWRIVWFRDEHPKGQISTEVVHFDNAAAAVRAIVLTEDGTVLGTGMAACDRTAAPQGRYLEKAETSAIGRALGIAGYGTQFTGEELAEDDHLSDSPVERPGPKAQPGGARPAAAPAPQAALQRDSEAFTRHAQKIGAVDPATIPGVTKGIGGDTEDITDLLETNCRDLKGTGPYRVQQYAIAHSKTNHERHYNNRYKHYFERKVLTQLNMTVLESELMGKIGLGSHYNYWNGSPTSEWRRKESARLLAGVIQEQHDADPASIAPPEKRLIDLVVRTAEYGEEDAYVLTNTWQVASDVIRCHMSIVQAEPESREKQIAWMLDYYGKRIRRGIAHDMGIPYPDIDTIIEWARRKGRS
jgi:hypothetical protein